MITGKLRKSGNSFIVTVPREEIDRQDLQEGDLVTVEVHRLEMRPALAREVREAFEASWRRNEAGYRYLARR